MSLKTSFCNKSIIKSDIRRFWWISALHTFFLFITGVFVFLDKITYRDIYAVTDYADSLLYDSLIFFYFFAIAIPAITGVFLFSYLHSGKMSAFTHSVPILRKTHYVSHIISGLILSVAPVIINAIILILMHTSADIKETFRLVHLLYIVIGTVIYTLIAFAGSVFVSSFVANSVAALIFTFVFGALPIVAESFWRFFLSTQLYGFPNTMNNFFFEFLYISPGDMLKGANPAIYLGLSLIFILAGYALYQKRNLEINAEIVAFPFLRPIFIYGAAIAGGCFGFSYFNAISDSTSPLALIPFGILGIIIATMIVKKSFRVFKAVLKPLIAFVLVTVAIFVVTVFDLTGYETRIPVPDKVESVVFDLSSIGYTHYMTHYDINNKSMKPVYNFEPIITDAQSIKNVTKLHKALVDNKTKYYNYDLGLTYNLKNGRTVRRAYPINYEKHLDAMEVIIESDVIRSAYFPIMRNDDRKIKYITIEYPDKPATAAKDDVTYPYTKDKIIYEPERIAEIIKALKSDLANIDYSEFEPYPSGDIECYVNIKFTVPYVYEDGSPVPEDQLPEQNENYRIRTSYTNTLEQLSLIS